MAEYIKTFILWLVAVLCLFAIPYFTLSGAAALAVMLILKRIEEEEENE